jgi:hypothetical protein
LNLIFAAPKSSSLGGPVSASGYVIAESKEDEDGFLVVGKFRGNSRRAY